MSDHEELCSQHFGAGSCTCAVIETVRKQAVVNFWTDFNRFIEGYIRAIGAEKPRD